MGSIYKRTNTGEVDLAYHDKFSLESQVLQLQEQLYIQEEKVTKLTEALELLAETSRQVTLDQLNASKLLSRRVTLLEKTADFQDKELLEIIQNEHNN